MNRGQKLIQTNIDFYFPDPFHIFTQTHSGTQNTVNFSTHNAQNPGTSGRMAALSYKHMGLLMEVNVQEITHIYITLRSKEKDSIRKGMEKLIKEDRKKIPVPNHCL